MPSKAAKIPTIVKNQFLGGSGSSSGKAIMLTLVDAPSHLCRVIQKYPKMIKNIPIPISLRCCALESRAMIVTYHLSAFRAGNKYNLSVRYHWSVSTDTGCNLAPIQ